jgi:hypothetical protein|tara:strand:- start:3334 stop:3582 length:249 start_codon:yes stop_codon:yes gene_type:complete
MSIRHGRLPSPSSEYNQRWANQLVNQLEQNIAATNLAASSARYTVTNVTPDRTFDANSTSTAELADVLGTLIDDLRTRGVLG